MKKVNHKRIHTISYNNKIQKQAKLNNQGYIQMSKSIPFFFFFFYIERLKHKIQTSQRDTQNERGCRRRM